ncbi:MAG TPA: hypothetical protein VI365_18095 [Trebonia sp.]
MRGALHADARSAEAGGAEAVTPVVAGEVVARDATTPAADRKP